MPAVLRSRHKAHGTHTNSYLQAIPKADGDGIPNIADSQLGGRRCAKGAMPPEGRYVATANPDGTIYVLRLAAPGVVYQAPAALPQP